MAKLNLLSKEACRWDLVSLGEVMLRLDPGEGRIHTTRRFDVWEGGGEYNVARGLRRCFTQRTAVVTSLVDNPVGRLVEDLILQGGVDTSHVSFRPFDGVGRELRNGLNFVERGFGPRGAISCSDRGHTAISAMQPEDMDLERLFSREKARWFHTGGIFCALGARTPEVARAAMHAARAEGTRISYDLNYRNSLWQSAGGTARAQEINREMVSSVDVLFGNEEDFSAALGFEVEADAAYTELDTGAFRRMLREVAGRFPNLQVIATSLRTATSASVNGWGGLCFDVEAGEFFEVPLQEVAILDRVGGGDSFAAGLIYGLLEGRDFEWSLRCAVAHGALAMSTPGDTTMARLAEVEKLMAGPSARIER